MRRTRTAVAALVALSAVLSGVPAPAAASSDAGSVADDPTATITVGDGTVESDQITRIDVRIDAPERIDGIDWLAFELVNASRAEIAGADFRGPGDGVTHVVSNRYASLQWSVSNASVDDTVVLSLFVRGVEPGEASIRITEAEGVRRAGGGTYDVDRRNGSLTVRSATGSPDPGGGASAGPIDLVVPDVTVPLDGTATLPVEVANATGGLNAAELAVALPENVAVEDVSVPASLSDVNVTRTSSGPVVNVAAVRYDAEGPTATVARIEVRGLDPGDTFGVVVLEAAGDRNDDSYEPPDGKLTAITVEEGNGTDGEGNASDPAPDPAPGAPPALGPDAAGAAGDPDGDGRYEDVDGDGEVNVLDVAALLDGLGGETVRSYPDSFDFTDDGEVNVLDVAALLDRV